MRKSESIKALAKALVLAKAKMEPPAKNKKANIGREYHYADLDSVKKSYQAAIAEQGMFVTHAITPTEGHLVLTTSLIHAESEEWIASDFPMTAFAKPQEQGSALTYFKRYNVCALLDIVAEDDDDGKAAQDAHGKPAEAAQGTQAPAPAPKAAAPATPPAPVKSALTNDEILSVCKLAKEKGLVTRGELAACLSNIVPGVRAASDLSKKDLPVVLEALQGMASKAVPA